MIAKHPRVVEPLENAITHITILLSELILKSSNEDEDVLTAPQPGFLR